MYHSFRAVAEFVCVGFLSCAALSLALGHPNHTLRETY